MSRTIQTHHSDLVQIQATDEPGPNGGNNRYELSGFDSRSNRSANHADYFLEETKTVILFQNGHPIEHGVNGVTMESLITVVIDRLMGFQSGVESCDDNREAVEYFKKGLEALNRRSDNRTEQVTAMPLI